MMREVYSYDLFDTLITRKVYQPSDVFAIVAHIAKQRGVLDDEHFRNFKKMRIKAETLARQKSADEEIDLDNIYDCFSGLASLPSEEVEKLKKLEMEVEKGLICPTYLGMFHQKPMVIISDQYLPEGFLKEIVDNFAIEYADFFLSSTTKKTKYTGTLFQEVMKSYKILEHCGDNKFVDYEVPAKLGIRSRLISSVWPTRWERFVYKNLKSHNEILASLLAGCMKAARVKKKFEEEALNSMHILGANIVSVISFCFALWIAEKVKGEKIEKVYFISRDGYLPKMIFEKFLQNNVLEWELSELQTIKYMLASRKTWYIVDEKMYEALIKKFFTYYCDINEFCRLFEIDLEEVKDFAPEILDFLGEKMPIKVRRKLARKLLANHAFKESIIERHREKLEAAKEYLQELGLADSRCNVALVDCGGTGTLQDVMSHILREHVGEHPRKLVGLYFGLTSGAFKKLNEKSGNKAYTFLNVGKNKEAYIREYAMLYEEFFKAPHGVVLGYKKTPNGVAVETGAVDPSYLCKVKVQIQAVETVVEEFLKALQLLHYNLSQKDVRALVMVGKKMLWEFITKPDRVDSSSGIYLIHASSSTDEMPHKLVEIIPVWAAIKIALLGGTYNNNPSLWREATLRLSTGDAAGALAQEVFRTLRFCKFLLRRQEEKW